jgi:EmrB/QacA subfamily drug resistance transporter
MKEKLSHGYKWHPLILASVGMLMATLDSSIVNLALPTLEEKFNTDITIIQWVIVSYTLAITTSLMIIGMLSDKYGRKRIYCAGFLIFTISSIFCALSSNSIELIFLRFVQGIGGSMIIVSAYNIIIHAFPKKERNEQFGYLSAIIAIGLMAGPVFGGFLIDQFGWQSIFYINIPVGFLGTIYTLKTLESEKIKNDLKIDVLGAVCIFISLTSLVLGITLIKEQGWRSMQIIGLFALFIAFLIIFLLVEHRSFQPMLNLSVFKNRQFLASNASNVFHLASLFTIVLLVPFHFENILGFSTKQVGITLILIPVGYALMSFGSGQINKIHPYIPSSMGMVICALALFLIGNLDKESSIFDLSIPLGMMGLGMGLFQPANNSIVAGSLHLSQSGIASSSIPLFRNLGITIGTAISGSIFYNRQQYYLGTGLTEESAFLSSYYFTFMVAVIICIIGFFVSLLRGKN